MREVRIEDIPFGRYISREELCAITGMNDRAVRKSIQDLRASDPSNIIISTSGKNGYKRPSSYDELQACYNESLSRINAERRKMAVIETMMKNRDQLGLGLR